MRCARGHSYDIARSGYVNLLQPQDKRARSAGDSREAVSARARLLAQGVGARILEACARRAADLDLPADPVVVDLGSGTGDLLAALARLRPINGIGIDLSTDAADHAARRHPGLTWVVANADRTLPLLDRTVDLVVSVHGRRNPKGCARVLALHGFVLVAVPAPDDLIELRGAVLGRTIERDRVSGLIPEYEQDFELVDRTVAREHQHLDRDGIEDLLRISYRGARTSRVQQLQALEELDVTLASEILVFRRT
jgi:23S rRNA (guanine745-N1)-methyltransferase